MGMKLAITVWENRISPVFDSAAQILLLELSEGRILRKRLVAVEDSSFATVLSLRKEEEIDLLLCGALCRRGEERLQAGGLEVLPFLSGDVDALVQSVMAGSDLSFFAMPGCRRQCCCRRQGQIHKKKRHGITYGG